MFVAKVLKTVVADEKHPILKGEKLMMVRPVTESGELYGKTCIAIDRAQAGIGEKVMVATPIALSFIARPRRRARRYSFCNT